MQEKLYEKTIISVFLVAYHPYMYVATRGNKVHTSNPSQSLIWRPEVRSPGQGVSSQVHGSLSNTSPQLERAPGWGPWLEVPCRMSILRKCNVACHSRLFSSMSHVEFKKWACRMSLLFLLTCNMWGCRPLQSTRQHGPFKALVTC